MAVKQNVWDYDNYEFDGEVYTSSSESESEKRYISPHKADYRFNETQNNGDRQKTIKHTITH
jgi:hypothetical protein